MKVNIRLIYLYLFSFVGLLIAAIGAIRLVELGLKVWVFKDADKFVYYPQAKMLREPGAATISSQAAVLEEEQSKRTQEDENKRQRQRETAGAIAMIVVGGPLYVYHWKVIQKENS